MEPTLEAGVPREEAVGGEVDEERDDGPLLMLRGGTTSEEGGEMERLRWWWIGWRIGRRVERAASEVKRSRSER